MTKLTGKARKFLRGEAHHLDPVAKIGKNGVTPAVIEAIDQNLKDHELIKVKFIDFKDSKDEICETIMEETKCEQVGLIGNIAIFFRQNEDPDERRIKLPS